MRRAPLSLALVLTIAGPASAQERTARPEIEEEPRAEPTGGEEEPAPLLDPLHAPHRVILGLPLVMQGHWQQDEPNETSFGPRVDVEIALAELEAVELGLDLGGAFLLREGDFFVPVDLGLVLRVVTRTAVVPLIGIGPVLTLDFEGEGVSLQGGGVVAVGLAVRATQVIGFSLQGLYRLVGNASKFEQQMAIHLGLSFYL